MDLKQELIDRLGVPKNWDKYDYQTQRYSFDDMQEVLEDIVKKLGRSEQLVCPDCKLPFTKEELEVKEHCFNCGWEFVN